MTNQGSQQGNQLQQYQPLLFNTADPLYTSPTDGHNTIKITPELSGAANFVPWKRQMELALATKRKAGFITGLVKRDGTDLVKKEAWDHCNTLVISWLINSMEESVRKTVMFFPSAKDIWDDIVGRFKADNGARKYQLSKSSYEAKQGTKCVGDYYTTLRASWDELENF